MEPGSAREEAERLVAAVLAGAAMAANAHPQFSTGSAECCICPLCKVIAAVRDPDPAMVERLATGAGDLAAGVASFLRNVSGNAAGPSRDPWAAAADEPEAAPEKPKKAAPKKAAKPAAPDQSAPQEQPLVPKKVVKKALRKKTES